MARGPARTLTAVVHHANSRMSIATVTSAVVGSGETRPDAAPAAMNRAAGMTYGARSLRWVPASQTMATTIAATMDRSTGELLPGPVGGRIGWKTTATTRVKTAARSALPRAGGAGACCGGCASRVVVIVIG